VWRMANDDGAWWDQSLVNLTRNYDDEETVEVMDGLLSSSTTSSPGGGGGGGVGIDDEPWDWESIRKTAQFSIQMAFFATFFLIAVISCVGVRIEEKKNAKKGRRRQGDVESRTAAGTPSLPQGDIPEEGQSPNTLEDLGGLKSRIAELEKEVAKLRGGGSLSSRSPKYLLKFDKVSNYVEYNALKDLFHVITLKPNANCDDTRCLQKQEEWAQHLKDHPEELEKKEVDDAEASSEVVHEDNDVDSESNDNNTVE